MERSRLLMTLLGLGRIGRRKAEIICTHISMAGLEASLTTLAQQGLLPDTATPAAIAAAARNAAASISLCARNGWRIVNKFEPAFPARLREIADPPLLLFYRGDLAFLEAFPVVAVIGASAASPQAAAIACRLGEALALMNSPVVSGLALGCDTAAHRGCLNQKGCTAAVLPNGLDMIYPWQNAALAEAIARSGCLISEYPPGVRPASYRFVERDRLQSGLSDVIIVVESEENGGAMHTARFAGRQGRRVLVFSPDSLGGSAGASGNKKLLEAGAQAVDTVEEAIAAVQAIQPGRRQGFGALF